MIEQVFQMTQGNERTIERIITNEQVHLNHVILGKGDGLPLHLSNANVYMVVLRGLLSIGLGDQEMHEYAGGTILSIPEGVQMNVQNRHDEALSIMIIKAPAPRE